jgi:transcriptional regulator with GAF, ATPase, and Fis domain
MPNGAPNSGDGSSPDPFAELRALTVEFDRRREEWRRQLHAILREQEHLENRRGSALARALRAALDPRQPGRRASVDCRAANLPGLVEAYERKLIEWALLTAHGCQKDAARLLGIGATTLHEKLKRFGLRRPQRHGPVPPGTRAFSSSNQSGT